MEETTHRSCQSLLVDCHISGTRLDKRLHEDVRIVRNLKDRLPPAFRPQGLKNSVSRTTSVPRLVRCRYLPETSRHREGLQIDRPHSAGTKLVDHAYFPHLS